MPIIASNWEPIAPLSNESDSCPVLHNVSRKT